MRAEEQRRAILAAVEQDFSRDARQTNAVFAVFGSCAQHAQHFESALGEFLLV